MSGWWASLSPGGSSANALTPDGLSDLGDGGDLKGEWGGKVPMVVGHEAAGVAEPASGTKGQNQAANV